MRFLCEFGRCFLGIFYIFSEFILLDFGEIWICGRGFEYFKCVCWFLKLRGIYRERVGIKGYRFVVKRRIIEVFFIDLFIFIFIILLGCYLIFCCFF